MESQPQNPEFRNNPEKFHPCDTLKEIYQLEIVFVKHCTKKYDSDHCGQTARQIYGPREMTLSKQSID